MINCVIIDDESKALRTLHLELKRHSDKVDVIGQFVYPLDAIEFINKHEVHLVFLDIEMPEMNGLEFIEQFPNKNFQVIFTTAYSNYAIKAIKCGALDYLLKPIDAQELDQSILKCEEAIKNNQIDKRIVSAIEKINNTDVKTQKVKIPHDGKIELFSPKEIIYFKGEGNYSAMFLNNGEKILLTMNLKDIEQILPMNIFNRIHNSYIVNLSKIKAYLKNEGLIELENQIVLPVSRQKRNQILDNL
ncbi:MAG TPA: LytTR family DNA-binding domain-containing protein [Edaphocola sp.]|nr:LytTR family DNA-binding domain-containing protein [Edaphocola sp.]